MSVIQTIREKYAKIMVAIIILAILGFILQDAFFGRGGGLFNRSTTVGKVDGEELSQKEYLELTDLAERNYSQQTGQALGDEGRQQVREQVWNQFISEQVMNKQFEKLGLVVTEDEISDQFFGKNPNPQVVQLFTDPQTGKFDQAQLRQIAQNVAQDKTGQASAQLKSLEDQIGKQQLYNKYTTLIHQGINYPKWMMEMDAAAAANSANISYVQVPYASIPDSDIKLTDAELNDYIQKHKDQFQTEENRRIEFISFNAIPSVADSLAAIQQLNELKAELDSTTNATDVANLINANSETKFFDGYAPASIVRVPNAESIVNLPVGGSFGPYYDNNLITYAKMVDRKTLPDTVKIRHIALSAPAGDSSAKARLDSLQAVIKAGGNFAALAAEFSHDNETAKNGGEVTITPNGNYVEEEKEFALSGAKGAMKVVKTSYGYALVEILEQKNFGPAIKVAYLSKRVDPSAATASAAYAEASEFGTKNRDRKTFENTIREKGLNKGISEDIYPMDFVVPGIGSTRELVRWVYGAKIGDVSPVFSVEDKHVVAVLTNIRTKGTLSLDEVRPRVEAEVRKIKKADKIIANLKTPASIEAAAQATAQPVMAASNINFAGYTIEGLGFEPRVIGASFNKAWGVGKVSAPIEGSNGVFVVKVDAYVPSSIPAPEYTLARSAYEQQTRQLWNSALFNVIKKKVNVVDNRAKFF
ncbi:peptidyl-prolyl cis-trans isomerase D [Chitinophaga skermanii]|uniref:Periplasmic chaperone PpiD n=1 Tax=Chitinophaga skermanii TaxID=331697 RepID=A0A327Q2T8_9BACT|nr:peptidylprolyl isomerase [Chitinophaga skermanii]RAI98669.1 peptidyl-prolyl cis-trans isomerase D [Chitinophaga skermanii]